MQRTVNFLVLILAAAVAALAQPQPSIIPGSVVNAASYAQPGLPNYGVAQGGIFILKGQNLGARGVVTATSFPLQTTMGGTSMKIMIQGASFDVLMIYVVAGQSNLPYDQLAGIVPSNVPPGPHLITVTFNGRTSATEPVTIVPSAFGIFTINQAGIGPGVFTDPNFKVNTLINAAHPGDLLFIWGTGLGPISGNDANTPPVGNLDVPVEVYVGNVKASVGYQGRSGCCSGVDQILITVPPGVLGCYVPVAVKIGNIVSNFATMSVASSGSVCSDPSGFTTSDLVKVQNGGSLSKADIGITRLSINVSIPGMGTLQGNVDQGDGHFRVFSPTAILGSIRGAVTGVGKGFPSVGCVVIPYTPRSQQFFDNFLRIADDPVTFDLLDAGPALNFNGPNGSRQIQRSDNGGPVYEQHGDTVLGGGLPPVIPASPDYLSPGTYTVDNGNGGPGVGAFTATLAIPNVQVTWTNEAAVNNIPRSQDLNLTISGSGLVGITGNSAGSQAGAALFCVAPSGSTSFTVPSWVLAALPASAQATDVPAAIGFLGVGAALSSPARFQARGVDAGYFSWGELQVKNVAFQ
ncbi:MAG TPA: hypothetical protein VEU96_32340 [Bryobacteraceae bacterium]|nr:hypothetical protein [Bryobacteraceae bacterium]